MRNRMDNGVAAFGCAIVVLWVGTFYTFVYIALHFAAKFW